MGLSDSRDSASRVRYRVEGLQREVEILIDRWGVPHIYAENDDDAFLAQGFNAARDRLWQVDLWRRRGLGLLSEVFGAEYVRRDRATRLFLYRGDMESEWASYGPTTEHATERLVAGINEYVALTERRPELLPPEFGMIGYRPARWSVEDVARIRSHGLHRNLTEEVTRAIILREFGSDTEKYRRRLEPEHEPSIPEGLDLSTIVPDALGTYSLATAPFVFPMEGESVQRADTEGSNNWVIGAGRTALGRPILANDPHRDPSLPSLRYICHLHTPEMNVIGAGEPVLPGISIGHNEHLAFGLTIFSIDQEDLYVYRTNPENPDEYRYADAWEAMEIEDVEIPVRGGPPARERLRFTRHGPVVYEDESLGIAFAVRAAWLEPGMAPYLGSVEYMTSSTPDEFLDAMKHWGSPGENQVYADTRGNIGWKAVGRVPRRPNWDGLLPVPGDGTYEWDGYLDPASLPGSSNPEEAWIATANQMNLPPDFLHDNTPVGFEWPPDFRHRRISEVLEAESKWTVEKAVELQSDYYSLPAAIITRVIERIGLTSSDPELQRTVDALLAWDHQLKPGSATAAIFEVWFKKFLRPAVLLLELYRDELRAVTADEEAGDVRETLALMERYASDASGDGGPRHRLRGAMLSSLREATAYLAERLGPDRSAWTWGALHHVLFEHPLSKLRGGDGLDVGRLPRGGSRDTVGNTAYRNSDFRQTGGATFRLVMDVGDWDKSRAMNAPGQSGHPGSPHYRDLAESWARDSSFPLLYTRERVASAAQEVITLFPGDETD